MRNSIVFLFFSFFVWGCVTQNISYNRNRILEKYSQDYQIFIDNQKVNFKDFYPNKDNIKNVQLNRPTRELKITQIKPAQWLKISEIVPKNQKIDFIIINGIPINNDEQKNIQIDPNGIETISVLQDWGNNVSCRLNKENICIIKTK